ncbi:MAG: hypothetical protein LBM61_07660 [Prevotellaceae bacterium]|nr:hypothetical protein [Prevotellaceae bacterium]
MKNTYFLGGLLVLGLLAACTQIEQPTVGGEVGDLVTLTVQREADPITRAEPTIPDGYKLRYILEIRHKAEQDPLPTQRIEQDNGSFAFILADGEYDFLIWSDYIAEDAELTKAKYPDKYYDTQNLNNIFRTDAVPTGLSECIAMDAFFGTLVVEKPSEEDLSELSVELKRPFARINLVQKTPSKLADFQKVSVSYEEADQAFDVQTGGLVDADAVENTLTLTNGGNDFQTAERSIFAYFYLFAPAEGSAATANPINVSFYKEEEDTEPIEDPYTVAAGKPYDRNYVTNLIGEYVSAGDLDVNRDPEYEVPEVFSVWDGVYPENETEAAETLGAAVRPDVYDITTADQLDCMAWLINEGVGDYSTYTYNLKVNIDLDDKDWTPIGDWSYFFAGTFDGGGHLIKNMNVNGAYDCAGFFGCINGEGSSSGVAAVRYLQVSGSVTTMSYCGGIVGDMSDATISFCSYEGSLATSYAAGGIAGFMAARNVNSSLLNCVSLLTSLTNETGYKGTILGYSVSTAGDYAGIAPEVLEMQGITLYYNYITNCAWTPIDALTIGNTDDTGLTPTNNAQYATVAAMFAADADGINAGADTYEWYNNNGVLKLRAVPQQPQ